MPVVKLNADFLKSKLHCPPDKRRVEWVSDDRSGLYIECRNTSPGVGTYYWRTKIDGKTKHFKIGSTDVVTLADAKNKVIELKAEVLSTGSDPRNDQKSRSETPTFSTFFTDDYLPVAKSRKRTWSKDLELFNHRLKDAFGDVRIDKITRQQIVTLHRGIKEAGFKGATADHALKLIRQILNLALDYGVIDSNPAAGIKQFNDPNQVEHYLSDEQLKKLLQVLNTDPNRTVCQICLFLLSTGARLSEALKAKWSDIDREKQLWLVPATNSKNKRVLSRPLNPSALSVIDQLKTEGSYDYLFINVKTGKPYTTIHKVWDRIRNQADVPFLRIHDLRHAYASFLVNSGRTLYEVQSLLGHSDPKVTQRYSHLSTSTLQKAANSASENIDRVMELSD